MKVWIDQDLCTGDGRCEEFGPGPVGMDAREAQVALWVR